MDEPVKRGRGRPRKPKPEFEPQKRPRGRPRKDAQVIDAKFVEVEPPKKRPVKHTKAEFLKEIEDGKRDANGVRLIEYDRFQRGVDYQPTTGTELEEMYTIARENMEKFRDGGSMAKEYQTPEDLQNAIIGYWSYLQKNARDGIPVMADLEGMCAFIQVSRRCLLNWERDDYKGFRATIEQAKNDIAACKKQLGQQGKIPPLVMAMDFNNNHGYTQKQEVVLTPNNPMGDATPSDQLMDRYFQLDD